MKRKHIIALMLSFVFVFLAGALFLLNHTKIGFLIKWNRNYDPQPTYELLEVGDEFMAGVVEAAVGRTEKDVRYDPAYVQIGYPMGDVPEGTGACTDVVIRTYRELGIDLQREVHEDMSANFDEYPNLWGLSAPDTNIDHRRVPNLMVFFKRHGEVLPITDDPADFSPGDLVTWDLGRGRTHIGLVTNRISLSRRPLIAHNVGRGPELQDVLFKWKIVGHFRYYGN